MNGLGPRLYWGVKESFRQYIAGISDGAETVCEGAFMEGGAFGFPLHEASEDEYRFRGRVDLTGYSGMLSLQIQNPWLHVSEESWWLTVVDPAYRGDHNTRLRFCTLGEPETGTADSKTVVLPAQLDPAATRMFDGVYAAGTQLDDITVVLPLSDLRVNQGHPRVSA